MHDLSTRQPNADGNPLSFLFDTNGESEVHGRDCIIKKNVGQVCALSLSVCSKRKARTQLWPEKVDWFGHTSDSRGAEFLDQLTYFH